MKVPQSIELSFKDPATISNELQDISILDDIEILFLWVLTTYITVEFKHNHFHLQFPFRVFVHLLIDSFTY